MSPPRRNVVAALGTAQTVAWASSFYLPTLLAAPMAKDLGTTPPVVFAALSMALLIGAFVSPLAGRAVDRHDGRRVLLGAGLLFVAGLSMLAMAQDLASLLLAWLLLGLAMGGGLYDTAFAALVRLYGSDARRSISGITLIAGFASTVGWPLTAWMEARFGWRGACWGWVGLHLLVAMPLLASLPRAGRAGEFKASAGAGEPAPQALPAAPSAAVPVGRVGLLALLFTCMGVVGTSVATQLPLLLMTAGLPLAGAVALAALAGPAQVAARLLELGWLSRRSGRASALATARLAALGHPLGAVALLLAGPVAALPFVLLHGFGNGLLTIVRGTLPLALFGAAGYGARQGLVVLPGRVLGAVSPFALGWLIERHGAGALLVTLGLSLVALLIIVSLGRSLARDNAVEHA